jgi:hypothetical protein
LFIGTTTNHHISHRIFFLRPPSLSSPVTLSFSLLWPSLIGSLLSLGVAVVRKDDMMVETGSLVVTPAMVVVVSDLKELVGR